MFLLKYFRRNQICIKIRLLSIKFIWIVSFMRNVWDRTEIAQILLRFARMPKLESKPRIFIWTQTFLIQISKTKLSEKWFFYNKDLNNVLDRLFTFSRRFYPKRFTVRSSYAFFISMCAPWKLNPQPFALLMQCSTTEPQDQYKLKKFLLKG